MRRLFGLLVALATIVLAGCGPLVEPGVSTPTPSPAASPSPASSSTPTVNPRDELFVYTGAATSSSSGRTTPASGTSANQRTVYVYDLTTGRSLSSFSFGSANDPALRALLVDGQIVTATARTVVLQHLDGSVPRHLYTAPGGGVIRDIAASPDGRMLAIVAQATAGNTATSLLRVLYVGNGGTALQLSIGDPRFAGFRGAFAAVNWQARNDGSTPAVVVDGSLGGRQVPSVATVGLDGVVTVLQPAGVAWLSPAGTTVATVAPLDCPLVAGHHLQVADLGSRGTVWQIQDPALLFTPLEWSPDGRSLVYAVRPGANSPSCTEIQQAPVQFAQADLEKMQTTAVPSLTALHQQWLGKLAITSSCAGSSTAPLTNRWQHPAPICGPDVPSTLVTIAVGGQLVGRAIDPISLGFINPPANHS